MGKRKSKSKKGLVCASAAAVIVIVAVILLVLFLIAPNPSKLADKYDSKDIAVVLVEEGDGVIGDAALDVADLTASITGFGFEISYYEDSEDAKEAYSKAKEAIEDSEDAYLGIRGKAVFIGEGDVAKDALKIFKGQLG